MTEPVSPQAAGWAGRLNRDCHCILVDREQLGRALERDSLGLPAIAGLLDPANSSFAASPVFLERAHLERMRDTIESISRIVDLDRYREVVFDRSPPLATLDTGPRGVFFGFDFHLAEDGPKLIEVNTNAGGALLNLYLARAQRACCEEVEPLACGGPAIDDLEREWVEMFRRELALLDSERTLRRLAIVDEKPEQQFLYPEMVLFRAMFERHGIEAIVTDPEGLVFDGAHLLRDSRPIDLVYNRMTDFYLESETAEPLASALRARAAAVTPHPRAYALWADKRNLVTFSDRDELRRLGAPESDIEGLLEVVPRAVEVTATNSEHLWSERKSWFFKPGVGFGSRGAYDGAKLTRKTFERLCQESYIAQHKVPPSLRRLRVDGEERDLKVDLRCVAYDSKIQLVSARLYRGQVTNLRTEGGGLATVFTTP